MYPCDWQSASGKLSIWRSQLNVNQFWKHVRIHGNCETTINRHQEWYHWKEHLSITVVVDFHVWNLRFEWTLPVVMQWCISCCACCAPRFFFPSEILKKPQTTTNQDRHHWKAHSLYSVVVDCQVYHRTWCTCGSRRSSQIMPLWQFSTGFAVLRWQ